MTFSPIKNQYVMSWYVGDDVKMLSQDEAQEACDNLNRHQELTKERDDARRERDELRTALTWLSGADTDRSSDSLVRLALGMAGAWHFYPPLGCIDRGCCIRAIQLMPWLLPALEKLEAQSQQWREQGKLIRAELNGEAKS